SSLAVPRTLAAGISFPSTGGMLLVGGHVPNGMNGQATGATEFYDPNTNLWRSTASLSAARREFSLVALQDGSFLAIGGFDGANSLSSVERFRLSANGQACDVSGECASIHCVQHICCDQQCSGPCKSCSIQGSVGTCSPRPNGYSCADSNICDGQEAC